MKRFFLVGCPRSGTTLLQCLIGAHSQIQTFPETALFYSSVPSHRREMEFLGIASRAAKVRFIEFLNEISRPELFEYYFRNPFSIGQYATMWRHLLDDLTMEEGKSGWLEKTPHHVDYLQYIQRLFPDAKVIHIIRNGADNIASMWVQVEKARMRSGKGWSLDETINRWVTAVRTSASYQGKEGHYLVSYEGVVDHPEDTLKSLFSFMELPFEHGIMKRYPEVAKRIVLPREEWKSNVSGPVKNANGMRFAKVFSDEERDYILNKIKRANLEDVSGVCGDTVITADERYFTTS